MYEIHYLGTYANLHGTYTKPSRCGNGNYDVNLRTYLVPMYLMTIHLHSFLRRHPAR